MNYLYSILDKELVVQDNLPPEYTLLIHILWRALRDLEHKDHLVRQEAVRWFLPDVKKRKSKVPKCQFTFEMIADYLDLGTLEMRFCIREVLRAKASYDKSEEEGEQDRAGSSQLSKKRGVRICASEPTVCGLRRYG